MTDQPVAGVAMGCVALLRLDAVGGPAPGNKYFKLMGNLAIARSLGSRCLVSFGGDCEVIGVAALKGATDLESRVGQALASMPVEAAARWQILHQDHCGGFARANAGLREFMLAFEAVQGIALEPVYTGKMLYAIHQRLRSGEWRRDVPLLAIHTGGLQGRRGFDWLGG